MAAILAGLDRCGPSVTYMYVHNYMYLVRHDGLALSNLGVKSGYGGIALHCQDAVMDGHALPVWGCGGGHNRQPRVLDFNGPDSVKVHGVQ